MRKLIVESVKEHMAASRAKETDLETANRRKKDKQCIATKRLKETSDMKEQSKIQNQQAMTNKCASSVALESATASFQSKIQYGPEYVSMSCHRMMYRQSVVQFDKDKYTKTASDVLEKVFSLEHKRVSHNENMCMYVKHAIQPYLEVICLYCPKLMV